MSDAKILGRLLMSGSFLSVGALWRSVMKEKKNALPFIEGRQNPFRDV